MIDTRKFYYCDHCDKSIAEHVKINKWTILKELGVIPINILGRHIEHYEPIFCSKECFLKFVENKIDEFLK